jgi:hypothetical protein
MSSSPLSETNFSNVCNENEDERKRKQRKRKNRREMKTCADRAKREGERELKGQARKEIQGHNGTRKHRVVSLFRVGRPVANHEK